MDQLEQMHTFVRIVEAGSISKAAEQMNTVKSAVSRRLSELEMRLGVSLLTRTTRRHNLTDAGHNYYKHCLRIIDDIAEVESSISQHEQALAGRIRLSAPITFGLKELSPLLTEFNQCHPDIYFDIDFSDRLIDLTEEGFDLAIRISHLKDSTLIAKRLTSIKLLLCASPAYLEKNGTPLKPESLKNNHVKLNYNTAPESWKFKTDSGELSSINLSSVIHSNNGDFLCDAAIAGQGIILLPDFICKQAIENGQLKEILPNQLLDSHINVYAVYPQNKHQPKRVSTLITFLAKRLQTIPT